MSNELPSDLIKISHAARIVGTHVGTVHRWIQKGRLRGWRIVGTWRVSRAELEGLLKERERPKEAAAEKKIKKNHKSEDWVYEQLRAHGIKV